MGVASAADRDVLKEHLRLRDEVLTTYFVQEADSIARLSSRMASRFHRGGRLLAFGAGRSATDAQHIAVEFVHPVVAGKRALPALDLSAGAESLIPSLARAEDIAVGLSEPEPDPSIMRTLERARATGALCVALPGATLDCTIRAASNDPFIHQEATEMLYHMLWESVQVCLEHQPLGQAAGSASFLYPFLGGDEPDETALLAEIAASVVAKALVDQQLRQQLVDQCDAIAATVSAMHARIVNGGIVLAFGNGGSATDANDFALDLAAPPHGGRPIAAVSCSSEAATITAIANDVGFGAVYTRQLIAHGRPGDVAVAISTSGGSANVIEALVEARRRGLLTIALLGYDGGEILRRGLADHVVVVNSDQIPRIQEVQATAYHLIVQLLVSRMDR
ncbi:MAG TPA: SIS domain-containing protein [Vicinamibacterales bacterium]|nr:SIS domain-containing protein [Vicinamibacterales bacterium]